MPRKRRFSEEPFGPTIQRLMAEQDVTYRALADKTGLSAGYLNHLVHGNRPVPSDDVIAVLGSALGVEPEHFREVRIRRIAERLERMPDLIDRLYKRLAGAAGGAAGRSGSLMRRGASRPYRARRRRAGRFRGRTAPRNRRRT